MSYIDYIKKSKISNEEWDVLLSQSSKKFLQGVLKSQISDNRFFGNELLLKLLYSYIFDMETCFITHDCLEIGSVLYRGRIYTESDAESRWLDVTKKRCKGYNKKGSYIAPIPAENRCTPKFVQCLYASNEVKTCISEVCPTQNDYISIAKIKVLHKLNIINLHIKITAAYNANDSRAKWINSFIMDISECFSAPIRDDKKEEYLLCQYISEFIKLLGFDGIKYESAKSNCGGTNYSIFSFEKCEPISSKLYKIVAISYDSFCYESN